LAAVNKVYWIIAVLVLVYAGCATKKQAEYGYSHPSRDTGDNDFFIGSFFSDGR